MAQIVLDRGWGDFSALLEPNLSFVRTKQRGALGLGTSTNSDDFSPAANAWGLIRTLMTSPTGLPATCSTRVHLGRIIAQQCSYDHAIVQTGDLVNQSANCGMVRIL